MNTKQIYEAIFPESAENNKKLCTKITGDLRARNPLRDICANVPQNHVGSSKICRKTTVVKTRNVRAKSDSSAVETKVKYYLKTENITERENKNEKVTIVDEVFVSGVDHYINYFPTSRSTSPSSTLVVTSTEVNTNNSQPLQALKQQFTGEVGETKKPPQKVNLLRKLSRRSRRITEEDLYKNCIYNEDYLEDNYSYMLSIEKKFVYRKDVLKRYFTENFRVRVVIWLHSACCELRLSEQTFFMAIRMFDYIKVACDFHIDHYTLVGAACLWIINKHSDVNFIQAPKLFALLKGRFSRIQIISLEKEILQALKFEVYFPEPLTFLFYYLKKQNLENNLKIRYSATFLLEMLTLLMDFSTLSPSFLAASALQQVLVKYNLEHLSFLEYICSHLFSKDVFLRKCQELEKAVNYLLTSKNISGIIVEKYSTEDKCYVAKKFLPY